MLATSYSRYPNTIRLIYSTRQRKNIIPRHPYNVNISIKCSTIIPEPITPELFHDTFKIKFGTNITVDIHSNYGNFYIKIKPADKPLSEVSIKKVFDFLKRWKREEYIMLLLNNEDRSLYFIENHENTWYIPVGISFFVKDPSNGF